jgi:hypothetical protein
VAHLADGPDVSQAVHSIVVTGRHAVTNEHAAKRGSPTPSGSSEVPQTPSCSHTMLKFDSDTVTGLGPGTRANILAQRSRSQRFWQENKERRQIRLEQRAAAETYRREEEAKRDRRDDPVQRRVAARQQAVAKAKRRLKKAPRPVVTSTQKPKVSLTSEERIALQKWRHRENAIEREQRELDERRQIRASEELIRKSWEQETAPKKVANPSLFSLDDAMAVVAPAFVQEEASPTRLEEHTEHAAAISSLLKPKDPVPLKKVISKKLAESPERASGASRVRAPEAALSASGSAIRPAGGGVAAARTLTNPYKPKPRGAPEVRYEAAASYSGSRPGMVFKRGDRGVGYYEDPLAPRVLMPTEPSAEPTAETAKPSEEASAAADAGPDVAEVDSDAVLERLKAKLRQDVDAAAPPANDAPDATEFLRALADADAAADAAAAPTDAAEPSPIAEHAPGSSPIDALVAAFASAASPSLVTAPGSALRVTTDDADDLPDSEVRLRAAEDAAEDALSKFDAAPLTGNYWGKAEAFRSALAAAEAELDEALATARSSASGAPADGPDADDALAED